MASSTTSATDTASTTPMAAFTWACWRATTVLMWSMFRCSEVSSSRIARRSSRPASARLQM